MRHWIFVLVLSSLTACAHLSNEEFAVTRVSGQVVICAEMSRKSCGMSLSDCAGDTQRFECVLDVEILDLKMLRKRAARSEAESDRQLYGRAL